MTDLLLLFPGVSEARFFPYLSLPMLTSFLRAHGFGVAQRDLNIALFEQLVDTVPVSGGASALADTLREYWSALESFVRSNAAELKAAAFGADSPRFPQDVAARLLQAHASRLLGASALTRRHRRLADVVNQAFELPEPGDLAFQVHDELLRAALAETQPRAVGISVAFFSQLAPALQIARTVRSVLPKATIALGGQQLMLRGRELAQHPRFFELVDVVGLGAGERTLLELLSAPADDPGALARIPGAITRFGEQPAAAHHLRENPPVQFDGLPFGRYQAAEPQLPIISCVGCYWGRCVFCSYGNRSLGRYQQLNAAELADRCAATLDETGVGFVAFVDENCNLKVILKAVQLLAARGYRFRFSTRNRFERVLTDASFCRDLSDAGCRIMSIGYETNSQRLLDRIDKGIDASSYQVIIDNLHASRIALRLSVMGGILDETPEEAAASRQFLAANADRLGIDVVQLLIAEPGTRLTGDPGAYGISLLPGDELRANDETSYLGGRVGVAYRFDSGARWEQHLESLTQLVAEVQPAKNAELHPRFRPRPVLTSPAAQGLRLRPWVVPGASRLIDLRWSLQYRLSADLFYDSAAHTVYARTQRGSHILGLLQQAEAGDPTPGPQRSIAC